MKFNILVALAEIFWIGGENDKLVVKVTPR